MKPAAGWYPVALEERADGMHDLTWQDLSAADFDAPFFEDAIRRAMRERPETRRTSLEEMDDMPLPPAVPPAAFVFHTSRSGSTLLTRFFSCLEGSIALSEPPIIDEILTLRRSDDDKVELLRQIVRILGQRRSVMDQRLFIKHDSWHLRWLPLIRRAFPSVPCFLCFRDPVEILWSHHRQRGSQMVPGLRDPALFDIAPESIDPADLDGFAARVLESLFARALGHVRGGDIVPLPLPSLTEQMRATVFPRLGIELTGAETDRIHERGLYHSKRAGESYQADAEKRMPEDLLVRFQELCAPRLSRLYEGMLECAPSR